MQVDNYHCRKCIEGSAVEPVLQQVSLESGQNLECVDKFCCLGDVIAAGGGAEEASRARVRCAWAKFRELAPILTSRGTSLKVKGKINKVCVQRVMIYGSETWPLKVGDMQRLKRTENMIVRWMCGVRLKNKIASVKLNGRLSIEGVADIVR
jgi:hypothetical protein